MNKLLRPVDITDLAKAYSWRNQDANRLASGSTDYIPYYDHKIWWENMLNDATVKVFVFKPSKTECGIVTFSQIDLEAKSAFWGFYLDTESQVYETNSISTWLMLENEAIELAKAKLKLKTLKCRVDETNRAVLMVHRKFGFREDPDTDKSNETNNGRKLITLKLDFC